MFFATSYLNTQHFSYYISSPLPIISKSCQHVSSRYFANCQIVWCFLMFFYFSFLKFLLLLLLPFGVNDSPIPFVLQRFQIYPSCFYSFFFFFRIIINSCFLKKQIRVTVRFGFVSSLLFALRFDSIPCSSHSRHIRTQSVRQLGLFLFSFFCLNFSWLLFLLSWLSLLLP